MPRLEASPAATHDDGLLAQRLAEAEREWRLATDNVIALVRSCACDAEIDEAAARERRLKHRIEAFQATLARTLAVDFIEKCEDQNSPKLVTLKQAAFDCGCHVSTVRLWAVSGEVDARRCGGPLAG
jgi:hypothetical protein